MFASDRAFPDLESVLGQTFTVSESRTGKLVSGVTVQDFGVDQAMTIRGPPSDPAGAKVEALRYSELCLIILDLSEQEQRSRDLE
jgi:hypothetical protein